MGAVCDKASLQAASPEIPPNQGVHVDIRGSARGEDRRNAEVHSSTGGLEADPSAERETCPIYCVPFSHWIHSCLRRSNGIGVPSHFFSSFSSRISWVPSHAGESRWWHGYGAPASVFSNLEGCTTEVRASTPTGNLFIFLVLYVQDSSHF